VSEQGPSVEVAPLQGGSGLAGFLLLGRWPRNPVEWAKFLVLSVRIAAIPGMLPVSTVFTVGEGLPEDPYPSAVGIVTAAGPLLGAHAVAPGQLGPPQPHAVVILHPPGSTIASVPEFETASGCVLLPGLPHLGLEHQAAWAEADLHGTVTQLISKSCVDPFSHPDTAALATLLAA
jgi:hypothetical protein